jgi:hypothetical protein
MKGCVMEYCCGTRELPLGISKALLIFVIFAQLPYSKKC